MSKSRKSSRPTAAPEPRTLVDELLEEQGKLTAVEKFSRLHDAGDSLLRREIYRDLIPIRPPGKGEQYAFSVDLDKCSGCKACVSACHSLNGLEDGEAWRTVGLLVSHDETPFEGTLRSQAAAKLQHVTTACHHCIDPGCLNGCPVLAYDKDEATGIVRHLDDQCIGCSYCVMKCPYEVPKYSKNLGIVRKCDMCANRLAVGEAPACAQACPTKAITITIVEQSKIRSDYSSASTAFITSNPFLPDSPAPNITLPTTRFITTRTATGQIAADHDSPRLDHAHWPLVIMLVLTQTAAGLTAAAAAAVLCGFKASVLPLSLLGMLILVVGLTASVAHLGKPLKAWRAFMGWRKSWLSREIIAFNIFAMMASGGVSIALLKTFFPATSWVRSIPSAILTQALVAAAVAGFLAVYTSAMVYVDTRRPFWSRRYSFANFFGTAVLLGSAFATSATAWLETNERLYRSCALASAAAMVGLFSWRLWELRRALKKPSNPIHMSARVVRELIPLAGRIAPALCAAAVVCGLMGVSNVVGLRWVWALIAAGAALASEILWRHVFFAAGASRKMPGGIDAGKL